MMIDITKMLENLQIKYAKFNKEDSSISFNNIDNEYDKVFLELGLILEELTQNHIKFDFDENNQKINIEN